MFENKRIALITGGSRGLGKNIALNLAKKGADIIISYHTQKNEALLVVSELKSIGVQVAALQLSIELTDGFPDFFKELFAILRYHFNTNRIDYLINNAGIGLQIPYTSTTEAQFDLLMNIHFKSVYFFT